MVEKKPVKEAKPAGASKAGTAKEGAAPKSKSLAHGKVLFQAFKWRGKWRFINKADAEKARKKRLATLAKLKSEGKKIVPKVSDCLFSWT